MSHFTVLVIGDDPEAALAPFQENNTGDCPKEFLVFNDMTEEIDEGWSEPSISRYLHPDGRWLSWGDPDMQEYAYGKKRLGTSVGGGVVNEPEHKEIPPSEVYGTKEEYAKEEYAEDYLGHEFYEAQGAYGYWENPNAKWDGYKLGGRWRGFFNLKPGAEGVLGAPRAFGEAQYEEFAGRADSARIMDIDFEGRAKELSDKAASVWDEAQRELAVIDDEEVRVADARWRYGICEGETRESFIKRRASCATHAVIKEGEWFECGDMGWWGVVHEPKDADVWGTEFANLLADLDPETVVSVYDCHI